MRGARIELQPVAGESGRAFATQYDFEGAILVYIKRVKVIVVEGATGHAGAVREIDTATNLKIDHMSCAAEPRNLVHAVARYRCHGVTGIRIGDTKAVGLVEYWPEVGMFGVTEKETGVGDRHAGGDHAVYLLAKLRVARVRKMCGYSGTDWCNQIGVSPPFVGVVGC